MGISLPMKSKKLFQTNLLGCNAQFLCYRERKGFNQNPNLPRDMGGRSRISNIDIRAYERDLGWNAMDQRIAIGIKTEGAIYASDG